MPMLHNETVPASESAKSQRKVLGCLSCKTLIIVVLALICIIVGLSVGISSLSSSPSGNDSATGTPSPSDGESVVVASNRPSVVVTLTPSMTTTTQSSPTSVTPTPAPTFNSPLPTPSPSLTTPLPTKTAAIDYEEWFNTTITLQDGVQFQVVEQLSHDPSAFTQGLTYGNGVLYESTGQRGRSTVRRLNPDTGEVVVQVPMDDAYFGEGMTYVDGKLVQVTYTSKKGFIYNAPDLSRVIQFDFATSRNQGWGITYEPTQHEFIVSDGSNTLHFWNVSSLLQDGQAVQLRTLRIFRQNGTPASQLNELEYWRNRILANVWKEYVLLVIHPVTGLVEKEYDFSTLFPNPPEVFNGISISQDPNILYVVGKYWDRMFKIKLLP